MNEGDRQTECVRKKERERERGWGWGQTDRQRHTDTETEIFTKTSHRINLPWFFTPSE